MADEEQIEITLAIVREVTLYRVPPRTGSKVMSGEWKLADAVFAGRCRIMGVGETAEVRFEDPSTGELFAMCPVRPGELDIAVEKAADSSRNFLIRLEDAQTKRHAFLGLGFKEADHLRHVEHAHATAGEAGAAMHPVHGGGEAGPDGTPAPSTQDLRLKEGETIRIQVKKPPHGHTHPPRVSAGGAAALLPLPPGGGRLPPPPAGGGGGLLPPPPAGGGGGWADFGGGAAPAAGAAVPSSGGGWADFDQNPPADAAGWATFD